MRILEQVQNRLVLQHRPLESWVAGGVLTTLGLGMLTFSAMRPISTMLYCDRIQPNFVLCHLHRSTWLGIKTQQTLLNVKAVQVAERRVKGGTQPYLILVTQTGEVEISNSQNQVSSIAEIQAFLSNAQVPALTLYYHQSTLVFVLIIVALGYACVALYLLMLPAVTCTFYKSLHKLVIERQRFGRTSIAEYPLNAIHRVEVEEIRQKNGKGYRIVLWLKSTGRLPLTKDCSNQSKSTAAIAQSLREFLHLLR